MRLQNIENEITEEADFTELQEYKHFDDIQLRLFGKDYQCEIEASWTNEKEDHGDYVTGFKIEDITVSHYDEKTSEDVEHEDLAQLIKRMYN